MKKEKKGLFAAINAEQSTLFISVKEAITKLAEDTEDSFSDIARTLLRIIEIDSCHPFEWHKEKEEFEEGYYEYIFELLKAVIKTNRIEVLHFDDYHIDPESHGWMRQRFLELLRHNIRGYMPPASLKEPGRISDTPQPSWIGRGSTSKPAYLNMSHPRYSAKLAAAVLAWEAMEDETLRRGKMPIAAMTAWLEKHYLSLSLVHKRGSKTHGYNAGDMNQGAIDDIAKICNWEVDGGPPPTPGN